MFWYNTSPFYALAHPIACSTIAYVLACTFLLLIAGHQNELKCMHETLHNCTTKNKRKPSCVFMCYNARKAGEKARGGCNIARGRGASGH